MECVSGCVRMQSDMFCFRENEVEVWACNFPLVLILGESKQLCLKIGHGDCWDLSEEELLGPLGRQLGLQPVSGSVWPLCTYVCLHGWLQLADLAGGEAEYLQHKP